MSANGNGHQWSKFWWGDWQNDKALQGCSLGARGLWIEILAVCHASEKPGYFLINGMPPTIQEMADMFGKTKPSEVSKFLDELCRRKIYSLEGDVIYCRRMVRDAEASEKGREAVERRWKTNVLDHGAPPGPITPPNRSPNTQPTSEPNRSPIREPNTKKLEAEAERKEDPSVGSPPSAGNRRANGTNPRANETNPRAEGDNPRSTGANPRATRTNPRNAKRLPEDWVPAPKALALGIDLGLSHAEVLFEADRMRDWARDKQAKGADWDARFANWLRREALDRRAQRYRAQPAKPTLAEEWGLKSFLTPNFDDDDEPGPERLLS